MTTDDLGLLILILILILILVHPIIRIRPNQADQLRDDCDQLPLSLIRFFIRASPFGHQHIQPLLLFPGHNPEHCQNSGTGPAL